MPNAAISQSNPRDLVREKRYNIAERWPGTRIIRRVLAVTHTKRAITKPSRPAVTAALSQYLSPQNGLAHSTGAQQIAKKNVRTSGMEDRIGWRRLNSIGFGDVE
jgi:hypothetical protein